MRHNIFDIEQMSLSSHLFIRLSFTLRNCFEWLPFLFSVYKTTHIIQFFLVDFNALHIPLILSI